MTESIIAAAATAKPACFLEQPMSTTGIPPPGGLAALPPYQEVAEGPGPGDGVGRGGFRTAAAGAAAGSDVACLQISASVHLASARGSRIAVLKQCITQ
jgi:hypothetical protein